MTTHNPQIIRMNGHLYIPLMSVTQAQLLDLLDHFIEDVNDTAGCYCVDNIVVKLNPNTRMMQAIEYQHKSDTESSCVARPIVHTLHTHANALTSSVVTAVACWHNLTNLRALLQKLSQIRWVHADALQLTQQCLKTMITSGHGLLTKISKHITTTSYTHMSTQPLLLMIQAEVMHQKFVY